MGALKDCDKSIELDPAFLKAYLRKGMKKMKEAMEVYEKALELAPDNEEAKNGFKQCAILQHSSNKGDNPEETRQRAMNDPEVMRKIMKLKDSGLISMQYR